ncbi:MAG: 13E12 repeat family protein, partial [Actinomycetota bacterium]|nr:13E12 repeat family protein [Actinomycetota bacterium]
MQQQNRRDTELVGGLHSLHSEVCSRHRIILTVIAELDERKLWRDDGCRDMAQWLAGQLGISQWMALRWVSASHAISNLPLTSKALESGRLCLDKVLELCRFATSETEQELIAWARRVTVATVRQRADVFNRPEIEEVRTAERARFLRWWWEQGGTSLGFEGLLPAAEGAALIKALER